MNVLTFFGGVLLGIVIAVGVACLVTCIASSVNGVTFGEQIISWATAPAPAPVEPLEPVVEAIIG